LVLLALALASRMCLTPVAGFYGALILLTSSGIFLFSHLLYPHLLCTLWITAAIFYFWRSLRAPTLRTAIGFALSCALGSLTLGLAGALLPVLIALLFLFFTRDFAHLRKWHPAVIVVVFCAAALPWRILAHHANPHHPYLTALPRPAVTPLLLFWDFLLFWIAPWTFFALAGISRLRKKHFDRTAKRDCRQQGLLLLVLWLAVAVLWFSIFQRHEYSMLPALPPFAILAATWLAVEENAPSRYGRIVAWVLFVAGMIKAITAVVLGLRAPFPGFAVDIATLLNLHAEQPHQFFGYLADLTFASMGAFRIPLLIFAAAVAVGVTANLILRLKGKARLANCFLAGMMAFVLIAAHIALNTFSPVFSSAILAEAIKPEVEQGDAVVINGRYEDASALGFYLGRPIQILSTPAGDLAPGSLASDAPPVFVDHDALAKLWDGPGRVFLWTSPDSLPELPGQSYVIAHDGGREIVSNEPNNGGAAF
ncbi:hypothetical protein, partial [Silvibacterium sp.]|uniref:glycosyltransferase family 39 protein n=1 Tax=Silvibacterium sp. TaxID=1964179 RepID=UPI0039E2BAD1